MVFFCIGFLIINIKGVPRIVILIEDIFLSFLVGRWPICPPILRSEQQRVIGGKRLRLRKLSTNVNYVRFGII